MQPDDDVDVNRKALRELLVKSFSSDELQDLCFDYFPDLYNRVEGNFGKHVVARLLIDYCERHGLIKYLLALVKENNPYQYTLFEEELSNFPNFNLTLANLKIFLLKLKNEFRK